MFITCRNYLYFYLFATTAFLGNEASASELPDTIDTLEPGPPSPDWESLVFWLSGSVGDYSVQCSEISQFYCLDAYLTQPPSDGIVQDQGEEARKIAFQKVRVMEDIIGRNWKHINMINEQDPMACCALQTNKYMMNGYYYKGMSPEAYWDLLSNYENENKPLNNIAAAYIEPICKNVIFEIGFGPGALRRDHNPNVKEGVPYIILGKEFTVGIPEVPSMTIDYHDPGSQLTFHWFKHNIMCRDHPSICGQNSPRRHERKKEMKQYNRRSGSKKSRRKKERQDWQNVPHSARRS